MTNEHQSCAICQHERKWHKDGKCNAYTCKHKQRFPDHPFDDGKQKDQGKIKL